MQDGRELHQALKARAPAKIDIGPVYTQDPAKRAAYKGESGARAFRPVERELVFDIDLTDYDDVRNSGSGTSMSSKCWILMAIAIKVPCPLALCGYWHCSASQGSCACCVWQPSMLCRSVCSIMRPMPVLSRVHAVSGQPMTPSHQCCGHTASVTTVTLQQTAPRPVLHASLDSSRHTNCAGHAF